MIFVFGQDHRQQKNLRLTMNETIVYLPGSSHVAGKELFAWFDRGRLSSDGGVLLLTDPIAGLDCRRRIAVTGDGQSPGGPWRQDQP